MPVAQYVFKVHNITVTRNMRTPIKITSLEHWFREARKSIGDLPNAYDPATGWRLAADPDVSIKWIRFDLENTLGEKAQLVIDRTRNLI